MVSNFYFRYGAEPNINHGLHHRGNRHHANSCRSDTSDGVAGDIPYIPPTAYIAVHTRQRAIWGVIRVYLYNYSPRAGRWG
eukprot:6110586-Pleurochrysis_carterae.AAC.1